MESPIIGFLAADPGYSGKSQTAGSRISVRYGIDDLLFVARFGRNPIQAFAYSGKLLANSAALLTVADICRALGVSRAWVIEHSNGRRRPVLPSIKLGKVRRLNPSDLKSKDAGDQDLSHSVLALRREVDAAGSLDFASVVRCQGGIPSYPISFFSSGGRSSYSKPGRRVRRSRRFVSGS
jgi:hypothetical protein